MTIYQFDLECPRCNKRSATASDHREPPIVNCGDCLFNDVEVVQLRIIGMREFKEPKP